MNTTKKLMTLGLVALLLVGCAPKEDKVDKVTPDEETQIATENPAEETPSEETPVVEEEKEETPTETQKEEDKTATTTKPAETKPTETKPSTTKPAETKPSTSTPANKVTTEKVTNKVATLQYQTVYQDDATLEKGKEKVIAYGVAGAKYEEVEITYTNGKETSRKVLRTWEDKPANQIVARGTKVAATEGRYLDLQSEMLADVNAHRKQNGVNELTLSSANLSEAKRRAKQIAEEYWSTGDISHRGSTGEYFENITASLTPKASEINGRFNNSSGHFKMRIDQYNSIYASATYELNGIWFTAELFQ